MRHAFGALAALLLLLTAFPAGAETRFEVKLREAPAQEPVGGVLTLTSTTDAALPLRRLAFEQPGLLVSDLEAGTWRVDADVPGYWSETRYVEAGGAVTLTLYPVGWLRVGIETDGGEPATLEAGFAPVSTSKRGADVPPAGEVECQAVATDEVTLPTEPSTAWRCPVPAGRHDLRLRSRGYASHFRWNQEIKARAERDLGTVHLVPGAGLFGFVRDAAAAGRDGATEIRVRLTPLGSEGRGGAAGRRARLAEREVVAGERGFFQFSDLGGGVYVVEATAEMRAAARFGPIEVPAGAEAELPRPLELHLPVEVVAHLTPALDPSGESWTVRLSSVDRPGHAFEDVSDPSGTWRGGGLSPGHYRILVEDARGSRWHLDEIEVEPGTPPIEIELTTVRVGGRVHRDDEPVAGRLTFGGERHPHRIVVETDLAGEFATRLPRAGTWPLSIELEESGARQALEPVTVVDGEDLDVELDPTHVEGRVEDGDGQGVPGVLVRAWKIGAQNGYSTARTDRQGRFSFTSLPAGRYSLSALHASGTAREVVEVEIGGDPQPVRLKLIGEKRVRGRVTARDVPVVGVEIIANPLLSRPRQVPVERRATDPQGLFELRVPNDATALDLVILAPGFAAAIQRVAADGQRTLALTVDRAAGTLNVELPEGASPGSYRLSSGGGTVPLELLRRWAEFHGQAPRDGGRWSLPMMATGSYVLCPPDGSGCESGSLGAGGELALELRGETSKRRD